MRRSGISSFLSELDVETYEHEKRTDGLQPNGIHNTGCAVLKTFILLLSVCVKDNTHYAPWSVKETERSMNTVPLKAR